MKKKKKQTTTPRAEKRERPTALEMLACFEYEAHKQFGDEVKPDSDLLVPPLPNWGKKIMAGFGKNHFQTSP